ncbi:Img2-domain-containing protein [Mytilinidion resinicola]|uniref:Large ribosomal subunit protein mL49 n=1 Tax=Mytilinidion resinicola TaxID=574789 RepID=A0A6A6YYW8_9PEZI|nr:Img2-domain-containing protein [Mytilinidion resinicola]KAF2813950.1 Img2-domain-containing protein [Mytilinidion resinicola]
MALSQPVLSFLRPLGPPNPSSFRHLLRFSTASRSRLEASTSPLSTPATAASISSTPSPTQSRDADIAAAEAATDADNPTSPIPSSKALPSKRFPSPASQTQKELRFHVARTPSNFLPVYKDAKAGGNKHLTTVRKISGDATQLKDELSELLALPKGHAFINPVTGHVVVKGWYKDQIVKYLESKNF